MFFCCGSVLFQTNQMAVDEDLHACHLQNNIVISLAFWNYCRGFTSFLTSLVVVYEVAFCKLNDSIEN